MMEPVVIVITTSHMQLSKYLRFMVVGSEREIGASAYMMAIVKRVIMQVIREAVKRIGHSFIRALMPKVRSALQPYIMLVN